MSYGSKGLNDLRDEATAIAKAHGFTDSSVGEDIALMHSELSEALEDYRQGHAATDLWYEEPGHSNVKCKSMLIKLEDGSFDLKNPRKPCGIPSEIADVIIRALHFCGKHGIDIESAVREKMFYNESRPFKHGGKKL